MLLDEGPSRPIYPDLDCRCGAESTSFRVVEPCSHTETPGMGHAQCLSRRFSNDGTLGALTTSSGNLFHRPATLTVNEQRCECKHVSLF